MGASVTPTSETRVSTRTVRQIARCKKCKTVRSRVVVVETTWTSRWTAIGLRSSSTSRTLLDGAVLAGWNANKAGECACVLPARDAWGNPTTRTGTIYYEDVIGTRNETPCDDRCTAATGHKCQCSCGGKNHGADHG